MTARLFQVTRTVERSMEGYVWAEDEESARRIAMDWDPDDWGRDDVDDATATEAKVEWFKEDGDNVREEDVDGTPPAGVESGLRAAVEYLRGGAKQAAAYADMVKAQVPLFEGLETQPLPCRSCGRRFPAVPHEKDCEEAKG